MKSSRIYILALVVIGLVLILFGAGCAKKEMVKEEPVVQAPSQPSAEAEREKALAEAAAKAKAEGAAKAEQLVRERREAEAEAREKAMAEEAATKAERETSQFVDIHFAFDKYDLDTEARTILDTDAKWLNTHPGYTILIEGNCDERGSIEYNIALGQRRADEAMKYLADLGIDKSKISTVSYGKEKPIDPGHNEEAWAKNRRDHFVVTSKK